MGVDPQRAAVQQRLPGVGAEEFGDRLVGDFVLDLLEDRPEEILLAAEVVVERPLGHAGSSHDLVGGRLGEALLAEELAGRSEEGGAGGVTLGDPLVLDIRT